MSWLILLLSFSFYGNTYSQIIPRCRLTQALIEEIHSHQDVITKIIKETTNGSYSGKFYQDLTTFTDNFGPRKTGTKVLENSISYLKNSLANKSLETRTEKIFVPMWIRETARSFYIINGEKKKLRIKAMGGSGSGRVTGPLIVVKNLSELRARQNEVAGKIVLLNRIFTNYEDTAISGIDGPAVASAFKARGILVRSATPFSIGNIHVSMTDFGKEKPIVAATISIEDADKLQRLTERGPVEVNMQIKNFREFGQSVSNNLIVDLPGKEKSNEYMVLSGHTDSWDVGVGAVDGGGGAFLAMHVLLLLKFLEIAPPKRTLRALLLSGNEMGFYGAKAYAKEYTHEIPYFTAAFESDAGLFDPLGFSVTGTEDAYCIIKEILSMFKELNTTTVDKKIRPPFNDIRVFHEYHVPLIEPLLKPNRNYWFSHTNGDSMRVMDSSLMDKNLAMIAGTAYVLANLPHMLPKYPIVNGSTTESAPTTESHSTTEIWPTKGVSTTGIFSPTDSASTAPTTESALTKGSVTTAEITTTVDSSDEEIY